jgi:hypothetical protein
MPPLRQAAIPLSESRAQNFRANLTRHNFTVQQKM